MNKNAIYLTIVLAVIVVLFVLLYKYFGKWTALIGTPIAIVIAFKIHNTIKAGSQ